MNPYIKKLKSTLDEISPNLSPGDSVLSLLYEAYTDLHNLDNAQIKTDFHDLYQVMSGMELGNGPDIGSRVRLVSESRAFWVCGGCQDWCPDS